MSDLAKKDDSEHGAAAPAALPVPEAAAASPWALVIIAVGAVAGTLLWRRRRAAK